MNVELKAILPHKFDYTALRRVMGAEVVSIVRGVKKDYENVTQTWKNKPNIIATQSAWFSSMIMPPQFNIIVGPQPGTDEARIFGYVDEGTRPHLIRPRRAKALAFIWGGPGSYKAKTRPMFLSSTAGGATGNLVFRQVVHHPGTKPRGFTKQIERKWQANTHVRMAQAVSRAAQASGHRYA